MVRYIYNVLSGTIVLSMSVIAFAISGLAETGENTANYWWFMMFGVWLVGFILQFYPKVEKLGIFITVVVLLYSLRPFILSVF